MIKRCTLRSKMLIALAMFTDAEQGVHILQFSEPPLSTTLIARNENDMRI